MINLIFSCAFGLCVSLSKITLEEEGRQKRAEGEEGDEKAGPRSILFFG